jgi:hypothetical protein
MLVALGAAMVVALSVGLFIWPGSPKRSPAQSVSCGAGSSDAGNGYCSVQSSNGYALEVPPDWLAVSSDDLDEWFHSPDQLAGVTAALAFMDAPDPVSLLTSELEDVRSNELQANATIVNQAMPVAVTVSNADAAYVAAVSFTDDEGAPQAEFILVASSGTLVVTLDVAADPQYAQTNAAQLQHLLASFQFLGGARDVAGARRRYQPRA